MSWARRFAIRGTTRGPVRAALATPLVVVLAAHSAAADAPAPPTESEQKAIALYQEGLDFARQQRWKEAENRFERVVAIRAAPPALFALGRAEVENGKFATAKTTLARVANSVDPQYAAVTEQARDALRSLEGRIPRLELTLPSDVKGATVTVDGVWIGATSIVELDCCIAHDIVVAAPKRRPFATIVTLSEGERRALRPILVAQGEAAAVQKPEPVVVAPPPPAPPPAAMETSHAVVGPVVLGAVGLAASIAGLVVRTQASSDYDAARESCRGDPPVCDDPSAVSRGNDARSRVVAGNITASVGLAAIAGAGLWWALSGTSSPKAATPQLGVSVNRDGPWAAVRWRL